MRPLIVHRNGKIYEIWLWTKETLILCEIGNENNFIVLDIDEYDELKDKGVFQLKEGNYLCSLTV